MENQSRQPLSDATALSVTNCGAKMSLHLIALRGAYVQPDSTDVEPDSVDVQPFSAAVRPDSSAVLPQ